jgi:hypothetical protein
MSAAPNTADIWTILNALGTIATAVTAILGLVFVVYQLRQNSRSLQIGAFESIFHDIRDLEKMWIEKNFATDMPAAERRAWCASFFNTIEYLCFLINHRMVRQRELRDFFMLGLREWWKQFQSYQTQGWITDTPEGFAEFKRLCKKEGFTSV